jgi:uncharacterized protein (TIGR03000 family)
MFRIYLGGIGTLVLMGFVATGPVQAQYQTRPYPTGLSDYGGGGYYYYQPPATGQRPGAAYQAFYPSEERAPVFVTIRVPANAEIWFNGVKTKETGTVRRFVSPAIEAGYDYTYEIQVAFKENGRTIRQTRQVNVLAGDSLQLNFFAR